MVALVAAARQAGAVIVVSALTIVEAVHDRTDMRRLQWVLSGLTVEGVEPGDAMVAVQLLRDAGGLHGHTHAIDALVAALALRMPGRPVVMASDPKDWTRLVGDRVSITVV